MRLPFANTSARELCELASSCSRRCVNLKGFVCQTSICRREVPLMAVSCLQEIMSLCSLKMMTPMNLYQSLP